MPPRERRAQDRGEPDPLRRRVGGSRRRGVVAAEDLLGFGRGGPYAAQPAYDGSQSLSVIAIRAVGDPTAYRFNVVVARVMELVNTTRCTPAWHGCWPRAR